MALMHAFESSKYFIRTNSRRLKLWSLRQPSLLWSDECWIVDSNRFKKALRPGLGLKRFEDHCIALLSDRNFAGRKLKARRQADEL